MGLVTSVFICFCALFTHQVRTARIKRQEPDYKSEDTVEDYAGNDVAEYVGNDKNDDTVATNDNDNDNEDEDVADYVGLDKGEVKEEPKDTFTDTFNDPYKDINNDNEDRFGGDRFEDEAANSPEVKSKDEDSNDSDESKHKKHVKKNKYLKKTLKKVSEFLKKVLDPNKLMQNAYVTEMLRRFSDHETKEEESKETEEHHEHHEMPPKKMRKRRGRPSKKEKIPPGISGLIKKGIMSLTQMEVDKKKLRRRVRLIKKIARKAKRPLKTAVKIFLSSRNQGMGGGYGGGGYGNNY